MATAQKQGPFWRREVLAGITTFASMAYILVVNPGMLAITGMDAHALVTATALSAIVGTLLMAALTNYPIALAPGMGLNAFFTFTICGQLEIPWQGALGLVFWTGVLFLILSASGFREQVVKAIPDALKTGIQAGIGLFILVIGLKNIGLFGDPAPRFIALQWAGFSNVPWQILLIAAIGLIAILLLYRLRFAGAILCGVALATIVGLFLSLNGTPVTPAPNSVVSKPASLAPILFQVDWLYPFKNPGTAWIPLLTLVFVDLFDTIGTLIGVSRQAGLTDKNGNLPKMRQALLADAGATTVGACLGTSPVTSYIESATGIEAGGKTGWTSVTVAICFLLALFFHPILTAIPAAAVAPALLMVGGMMMVGLKRLDWKDWRAAIPALAIVLLIPLNFQIAEGIAAGFVLYTILMYATGQWKRVHWFLAVLSALFLVKLIADIAK